MELKLVTLLTSPAGIRLAQTCFSSIFVGSTICYQVAVSARDDSPVNSTLSRGLEVGAIVAAEYFIDVDPRQGSGTPIAVKEFTNPMKLTEEIPRDIFKSLSPGPHSLACRIKGIDGEWSIAYARPFFLNDAIGPEPSPIYSGEYFVDDDPGQGQGNTFTFSQPALEQVSAIDVTGPEISALKSGTHFLSFRARDERGSWSVAFSRPFFKDEAAPEESAAVEKFEIQWYLNNFPVAESAFWEVINPGREVSAGPLASVSGLSNGTTYQLVVTPVDSLGRRGIAFTSPVRIQIPIPIEFSTIHQLPDGTLKWTVTGLNGRLAVLQVSNDLAEWSDFSLLNSAAGNAEAAITPTAVPHAFLRVVVWQQ